MFKMGDIVRVRNGDFITPRIILGSYRGHIFVLKPNKIDSTDTNNYILKTDPSREDYELKVKLLNDCLDALRGLKDIQHLITIKDGKIHLK